MPRGSRPRRAQTRVRGRPRTRGEGSKVRALCARPPPDPHSGAGTLAGLCPASVTAGKPRPKLRGRPVPAILRAQATRRRPGSSPRPSPSPLPSTHLPRNGGELCSPRRDLEPVVVPSATGSPCAASTARPAGILDDDGGVGSGDDFREGRGPGLSPLVGHDDRGAGQLIVVGELGDPRALEQGAPLAIGESAGSPALDGRLLRVGFRNVGGLDGRLLRVGLRGGGEVVGEVGELLLKPLIGAQRS